MEKKFTKIQIATIKKVAQIVQSYVTKKEKLNAKIAELEQEKEINQALIEKFQGPIREMTGGYSTEDLVKREITPTGKFNDAGKEIMQTRYSLIYPETVVPVATVVAEAPADEEPVAMEMPPAGNDFDIDAQDAITQQVAESEAENDDPWA